MSNNNSNPQQSYGQYGQGYGQYNQNYGEYNQNYGEYNQTYGQPYGQPSGQGYGDNMNMNYSNSYGHYQEGPSPTNNYASSNFKADPKKGKNFNDVPEFYGGEQFLSADLDRSIRHAFVRKVFTILTICLLISFGFAACVNLIDSLQRIVIENYLPILIVSMILYIVPSLMIVCSETMAQKVPLNFILLGLMVIGVSGILGTLGAITSPFIFFLALGITFAVSLSLMLFAIQVKYDFTGWGPYMWVAFLILMIMIIVGFFVREPLFHTIISGFGALLVSFLLILDTQMIVGGKHRKYQIGIDEYMAAVVILYIDIVALFTYILQLVSIFTGDN